MNDPQQSCDQVVTVAVVGAGMSGLTAARELQRQGIDTVVLEAADRVGGRMLAETTVLGSRVDLGGQWIGRGHHRYQDLANELGATTYLMRTPKIPAIVEGNKTLSLTSPSLMIANATLIAAEILSRLPVSARWNTVPLRSWINKVPTKRARSLLEVLTAICTTGDSDQISVEAFLTMIRFHGGLAAMLKTTGGAQESLVIEGAATLADGVAAELGPRVRTGCRVTAVRQHDNGVSLTTTSGCVHARKVIIAVPVPLGAQIVFEPELPEDRIALQHNMYMGSVYKAIAVYDRPFWRDRREAENIRLGSVGYGVFDTSPPRGPGHLCFLVGGHQARILDDLDLQRRRSALLDPLAELLGPDVLQPLGWHEKAWHRDEFVGGGYSALPKIGTREGIYPIASTPIGDIHWAGTETAAVHAGYIEGAIAAGIRAANEITDALHDAALPPKSRS